MKTLIYCCFAAVILAKNIETANESIKFENFPAKSSWHANFSTSSITINMESHKNLTLTITGLDNLSPHLKTVQFRLTSSKTHLATVTDTIIQPPKNVNTWQQNFTIYGNFLGNSKIYLELLESNNQTEKSSESLNVIIIRKPRIIDHVFTGSVILLVSLLYINFGAALDLTVMKDILVRPIGPVIGFFGQFLVMPLLSFALGYILFPNNPDLHLGLFFTGVSPGGGASNIWTVILQGNINLSIVMTTVSTFAAFGMMPLWIFTLGKIIFERGNYGVPYDRIASFAFGLIIPLLIGIGIQRFFPRISRILVRLLKPISILLIIFIVIFAIITNLYLFELFSWQIVVAGLGLPWLGYTLSWCIAKLFKQSGPNAIAIAVETGIQNTGIAIFLLRFSLEQPEADLTTVMPVSVAIMTPLPLFLLYLCQKFLFRKPAERVGENQSIIDNNNVDKHSNS